MNRFAFIINTISIEEIRRCWPLTRVVPNFLLKQALKTRGFLKFAQARKIKSSRGKEIEGYLISLALISRNGQLVEDNCIIDKVIRAGRIAEERLNVGILGLGGPLSAIQDKNNIISRNLKIPITNGSALTAWSVVEAVYRLAKIKNKSLKEITLAVIGADSVIGSLCVRKISEYTNRIIIIGSDRAKLETLKETVLHINPIEVVIGNSAGSLIKDADIVINADNSFVSGLRPEELKQAAIFCDIANSYDLYNKIKQRGDIVAFRGGLMKRPQADNKGLLKDIIPAALAEVMLLTFEERFVSYSLGENINPDRMEEIADMAVRHGFEVWVPDAPVI